MKGVRKGVGYQASTVIHEERILCSILEPGRGGRGQINVLSGRRDM